MLRTAPGRCRRRRSGPAPWPSGRWIRSGRGRSWSTAAPTCGSTPQTISCSRRGAGGAHALHRARVDRLHRLGEQLGQHAAGVDRQRHAPPAKGPSPTATMNTVPTTRSGTERRMSISRRTGCWIHSGEMLRDAARPSGMAIDDRQGGAPQRDLHRQPHLGDIGPPVAEVGVQEARPNSRMLRALVNSSGSLPISTGRKLIASSRTTPPHTSKSSRWSERRWRRAGRRTRSVDRAARRDVTGVAGGGVGPSAGRRRLCRCGLLGSPPRLASARCWPASIWRTGQSSCCRRDRSRLLQVLEDGAVSASAPALAIAEEEAPDLGLDAGSRSLAMTTIEASGSGGEVPDHLEPSWRSPGCAARRSSRPTVLLVAASSTPLATATGWPVVGRAHGLEAGARVDPLGLEQDSSWAPACRRSTRCRRCRRYSVLSHLRICRA